VKAADGRTLLADRQDEAVPLAHLRQILKITMRFNVKTDGRVFLEGSNFIKQQRADAFPWGQRSGWLNGITAPAYIAG